MQEADGDRADILATNLLDRQLQTRLVERCLDRPVPAQALDHLYHVPPRHQPLRLPVAQRVELLAIVTRDRERVSDASGEHQQHTGSFPLEKGVQADRRAVHEEPHLRRVGDEAPDPGDDAVRRVVRRRRHLAGEGAQLDGVRNDEVGERTPDVRRDPVTRHRIDATGGRQARSTPKRPAPAEWKIVLEDGRGHTSKSVQTSRPQKRSCAQAR